MDCPSKISPESIIVLRMGSRGSERLVISIEPELLKNKWWKHYFGIPYRAERKTVQSVTFIAKKGSKSIFVAKRVTSSRNDY